MAPAPEKIVFIAAVSEAMRTYREVLARELLNHGCVVKDAPADVGEIPEVLEQCEVAIHLLSDQDAFQESDVKGIEEIQIQLSVQQQRSRKLVSDSGDRLFRIFAWHPKVGFDNFYKDEKMASHLLKIEQYEEVEFLRTNFEDFKYYILRRLTVQQIEEHDEFYIKGNKSHCVYFIYDRADQSSANEYLENLSNRGYAVLTPTFDDDIISVRKTHTNHLKRFDIAIIFAREASTNWINMKIMDILKAPGLGREREIIVTGILTTSEKMRQLSGAAMRINIHSVEEGNPKSQLDALLNKRKP